MRQSVLQRSDLYDLSSIDGLLLSSVPSCENPSGYPGSSTYLFSDPEGVRITFNSSGAITSGASYNPYGQLTAGGVSSVTPFGYGGGYTDPTGLIYFVNRYYDPSTGQFISVDPLVGITDQPYQYVGSDPVNGSDPLGLCNPFGNCLSEAWHDTAHGFDVARHAIAHYADNTGHFVNKHKAAIGEIAVGVAVVTGVVIATVATGGLADAVAIGAAGAAEELANAAVSESLVGLFGLTFPLDAIFALAPVALVGLGGLALTVYGAYELYSQLSGGSTTLRCKRQ